MRPSSPRASSLCGLLVLASSGCGDDGPAAAEPAPTPTEVVGACGPSRGLDLLWDLSRNDVSGIRMQPAPGPGWVLYQDPDWPLLGFTHPPDWTAESLSGPSQLGVRLVAPGRAASFLLLYVLQPRANLTTQMIVDTEMASLAGARALGPPLCADAARRPGVVVTDNRIEARAAGSALFMVQASVSRDPGNLGFGAGVPINAAIYRFAGEADDFTRLTEQVFLPIIFQLNIGSSENRDTDGDGVFDRNDSFPFDPNRS